jgi:hypothetical protein
LQQFCTDFACINYQKPQTVPQEGNMLRNGSLRYSIWYALVYGLSQMAAMAGGGLVIKSPAIAVASIDGHGAYLLVPSRALQLDNLKSGFHSIKVTSNQQAWNTRVHIESGETKTIIANLRPSYTSLPHLYTPEADAPHPSPTRHNSYSAPELSQDELVAREAAAFRAEQEQIRRQREAEQEQIRRQREAEQERIRQAEIRRRQEQAERARLQEIQRREDKRRRKKQRRARRPKVH